MVPAIKVFIDSGVLIEYLKGNGIAFFDKLILSKLHKLYINQIVVSEFLFHYIAIHAQKSPLSAKKGNTIQNIIEQFNPQTFIEDFNLVNCTTEISVIAIQMMKKYNVLPNDAIIIASCIENNIEYIATYDSDFEIPCKSENIKILNDLTHL